MQKRAWNKALRTDAIAVVVVVFALISAFVISLVLLAAKDKTSSKSAAGPRFPAGMEKNLETTLDKVMAESDVPGAIVGIWAPGRGTWVRARGVADIKNNQPMDVADHVRIASITKTFVATVVLQLVDSKRLSLDDTLDKFAPNVPNASSITVRELLNQTSGLYDFLEDSVFQRASLENPLAKLMPDQLLSSSVLHQPYFAPGTGYHYSNTNYVLLGMIIEKVTGHKVGAEIEQRILQPMKLKNTSFPVTPQIPGPASRGYSDSNGSLTDVSDIDPSMGWASSAMISDLEDLKTWAGELATGGLVSEEAQKERMTFRATDTPPLEYGLGLMKWGEFIGHEGNAFGYSTTMFYLPSQKATIVVILNEEPDNEMSATAAFIKFAKLIFPEQTPLAPQASSH
jgi:D-alanyl-D-alanine carboxypeptidase